MNDVDRDRLIRTLGETFADIPRPECTKRVARALDDEWFPTRERVEELRALDCERNWQELTANEICEFSDVLTWLSPDGFRFYFPAFLAYSIKNWDGSHCRVHEDCMEAILMAPTIVERFTGREAQVAAEILTELSIDPRGRDYDADPSICILERRAREAERAEAIGGATDAV